MQSAAGGRAGGLRRRRPRYQVAETWPTADHRRVFALTNKLTLFKFVFPRSAMKGHGGTFKVSLLSSPSGCGG